MQIIRAILAGERDPVVLAQFRNRRCKSSKDEIAKALEGNYRVEHVFALQQAVELFDFYTHQMVACDTEIEKQYAIFQSQVDSTENLLPPRKVNTRTKNRPAFDLRTELYRVCGVDLTSVDGIDVLVAQDIIAEVGMDTPSRTGTGLGE